MANVQSFLVSGPTAWCVGTGATNALEFLGYCEGDTTISITCLEEDVRSDRAGPIGADDTQHFGSSAIISGVIVKYSEAVMNKLVSFFPNAGGISGNQTPGSIPVGGIGSLMDLEGNSIRFLVYCPYNNKAIFSGSNNVMNPGYNFLSSWLNGSHDVSLSTRVKRLRVTMRGKAKWTTDSSGNTSGILWNTTVTGLPTFNVT